MVTKGIRSFTTTPYVFAVLDRARAYTGTPSNKTTYRCSILPLAPTLKMFAAD